MGSNKRKRIDDNTAGTSKHANRNSNYFYPLQTLIDDKKTADDVMDDSTIKTSKVKVPPITIVKSNMEKIHEMCKHLKIIHYAIRKISIGHKLFCDIQYDFDQAVKFLKDNNVEYFTYTAKNNRPYKVILSGLDKTDHVQLKSTLIKSGLQCIDVKPIFKKQENREIILYVIYLKKGTVTLKELREKHNNINFIRVKWSYQTKRPDKVTQCYNCQMFGHGSDNCNVKTFCAKCSGPHKTPDCKTEEVKCVNCQGDHKSTDNSCPSRNSYVELRKRFSNGYRLSRNTQQIASQAKPNNTHQNTIQNQPISSNMSWANIVSSNGNTASNDLFSVDQLKEMTFELIKNLRNCKTKIDQLDVITSLAFKFLN